MPRKAYAFGPGDPSGRGKFQSFTPEDWAEYATQKKVRQKALNLIKYAVQLGTLPSPLSLPCVVCHNPAHVYHHPNGYTGKAALEVVAVCRKCHSLLHSRFLNSDK